MGYKPLPSDEYLAEMLGLTPAQMEWFQQEIDSKVKIDPGVPQAGLETLAIVSAGLQAFLSQNKVEVEMEVLKHNRQIL
jgi:hypothetical protein